VNTRQNKQRFIFMIGSEHGSNHLEEDPVMVTSIRPSWSRQAMLLAGALVAPAVLVSACGPRPESAAPPTDEATVAAGSELDELVRVARDPEAGGRDRMDAIAELGARGDRRAVPALVAVLDDDMSRRTGVWAEAIPALGALGDARAVPILLDALERRDDDWLGREMAAAALGEIGDPAAVPALLTAATMADTRPAAVAALAAIGDPQAAPLYVEVLAGGDDPGTVATAELAVLELGPVAVPHLVEALGSPPEADEAQAVAAARLLGRLGEASAAPALREAAGDPRPEVSEAASAALLLIEGKGKDS
jgi:HEAT repeat protein